VQWRQGRKSTLANKTKCGRAAPGSQVDPGS